MSWTGLEVYYTPGSPGCRAVLMCIRELELEVELIKLDMYQKYEHKKPWFIRMNPQHTVPTINDNGFILWESRAIMQYLVSKYGSHKSELYPTEPMARAAVDKILFFDIGTLYKSLVDYFHPQLMSGEEPDERKGNAFKQALDYLDQFLETSRYVAGDTLTIADISVLAT
ncbi:glutathione S-transferase 1 [Eurytemora carolleeae]|uniref:glutathione S-transferase 1 n=1 Tax=Eurytemora carolleeae TaxID=1294199 RepID=UPI000C786983|nr:glutathione S-transferase 1 [Eurytemora carolleeae]|eukprot:XP_023336611.1 glutathione S-transferase 1-like [Eurytemora affinis]